MAIEVVPPLQRAWTVGLNDTVGSGFTVISTIAGVPRHELAVGVIVYLTIAATFVLLVIICEIGLPDPPGEKDAVPLIKLADQAYTVPLTAFGFVMVIAVGVPLHIVSAVIFVLIFGIGLTVTGTFKGLPGQLFAVGVIA